MCVVVLSTLIGLFGGSIGPFARTAPGFMFFHALYNAVILFWIYGYWPVGSAGRVLPVDERRPLVENPFQETTDTEYTDQAPLFKTDKE